MAVTHLNSAPNLAQSIYFNQHPFWTPSACYISWSNQVNVMLCPKTSGKYCMPCHCLSYLYLWKIKINWPIWLEDHERHPLPPCQNLWTCEAAKTLWLHYSRQSSEDGALGSLQLYAAKVRHILETNAVKNTLNKINWHILEGNATKYIS